MFSLTSQFLNPCLRLHNSYIVQSLDYVIFTLQGIQTATGCLTYFFIFVYVVLSIIAKNKAKAKVISQVAPNVNSVGR